MTLPLDLAHAQEDFDRFLLAVMDRAGLATRHQAYTVAQGVLRAFRRRLTPREAVAFAQKLPPLLRAIFVDGWDLDAPPVPFGTRSDWTADARALRPHHNLAGEDAVASVAAALRAVLPPDAHGRLADGMPEGSAAFWR